MCDVWCLAKRVLRPGARTRNGARPDILEKVTHNAKGSMIDHYTKLDFLPKCQAVGALRIDLSGTGGPCWPPRQLRSNYASEGRGDENPLFLAGNSATPTGSAQCETPSNLLNSAASEALGEVLGPVRLVA